MFKITSGFTSFSLLVCDLELFSISNSNADDDFTDWFSITQKQLDKHAPIKTRGGGG